MALVGTNDATKYWKAPSRAPAGPLWVSSWTKGATSLAAFNQEWIGFRASANNNAVLMTYIDNVGGDLCTFVETDTGSFEQANNSTPIVANVWNHTYGDYAPSVGETAWVNGVMQGQNSTSTITGSLTLDTLVIASAQTTGKAPTDRFIAECVFGTGTLSAAQIRALAQGRNPLSAIPPGQILAYFPLRGDLTDHGPRRVGMTPIGAPTAVWAEHPPVAPPPRRRLFRRAVVAPAQRPRVTMVV